MAEGYIKLYRQLCDNPMWTAEKFTPAQAWVDLLLNANHKDDYFAVRGNKVDIKRGQIGWSEVTMSARWKWSRTKVRNFLKTLEKEQQIEQQKTPVTTIITILNYDKYQNKEQQKRQQSGQQKDSRKTAERQQKNINKNDKNGKKKEIKIFVENSPEFQLSNLLKSLILTNNPGAKVPDDLNNWALEIDRMIRLDKRTPEQIETVIRFSQKDSFWMMNILSTGSLRKQFDKLWLKSKQPEKTPIKPQQQSRRVAPVGHRDLDKILGIE